MTLLKNASRGDARAVLPAASPAADGQQAHRNARCEALRSRRRMKVAAEVLEVAPKNRRSAGKLKRFNLSI
jgi:hypothetical protein